MTVNKVSSFIHARRATLEPRKKNKNVRGDVKYQVCSCSMTNLLLTTHKIALLDDSSTSSLASHYTTRPLRNLPKKALSSAVCCVLEKKKNVSSLKFFLLLRAHTRAPPCACSVLFKAIGARALEWERDWKINSSRWWKILMKFIGLKISTASRRSTRRTHK